MTPDERKTAIKELDHRLLDVLDEYVSAIKRKKDQETVRSILIKIDKIKWQIFKLRNYK